MSNKKTFCTAKETINKTKRQPTKWEYIFTNFTSVDKKGPHAKSDKLRGGLYDRLANLET